MTGRALIVGAGVAGLSAAWWLTEIGWEVEIVERAPDLRADGYMLGLSGPGFEAARRMGLIPALKARDRRIRENLYLGRTGKVLMRLRYPEFLHGLEWVTMARTDLVEVLHAAMRDRAPIRFGTTLADLSQDPDGVDVGLSDGSRRRVDLVIGADGVHSALRARIFGEEGPFASHLGYRVAAFQAPDTLKLGHDFLSYAEPGRLVSFYTLAESRMATLYIWRSGDVGFVPAPQRREVMRRAFAGAHADPLAWIEAVPEIEAIYLDDTTMIALPRWSQGRVLLLGDAAHCLTLLSGQGAGISIASACVLAEELAKEGGIDAALARHEARMRPTIQRLQDRSRRIAKWFIPQSPLAFALRNAMLRWLPRRWLSRYISRGIRSEVLVATETPLVGDPGRGARP